MAALISQLQDEHEQKSIELDIRQHADTSEADAKVIDLKKAIHDLHAEIPKVRCDGMWCDQSGCDVVSVFYESHPHVCHLESG